MAQQLEIPKKVSGPDISGAINKNTTTAKGLELVIMKINAFIKSAQASCDNILYGKYELQGNPNVVGLRKALDRGLLNVLGELSSIDFCNIFSYIANKARLGQNNFDPNSPPQNVDPFENRLWLIKKKAFDLQSKIDKYYATWGSSQGQDSRLGLIELVRQINITSSELLDVSNGFNNPDIKVAFPEVTLATNFIENITSKFRQYSNTGIIPVNEIQAVIDYIEKFKIILVSIQGLNRVSNVLAGADVIAGGAVQEQIARLNKIVAPQKAPKFLKDLLKEATKINNIGRKILSYINLLRVFIKLALLLIKIFYLIRNLLLTLPIPNILTTAGVTTTISNVGEDVIKEKGIIRFIRRLQQINILLTNIFVFATGLVAAMDDIILKLRAILLNIESCNPELANDISDLLADLESTRTGLQEFINDTNSARKRIDNTFGGYTIEIVTEELVDEGISLKRRFGIARGADNIIAVQSTPTFASLDLIIINEVKVLLVSKGLVKEGLPSLSPEDTVTVMDAMNYLGDEANIEFDINTISSFSSSFSETDDEIGLSSFVNNLPGGKAMRKKARKKLIERNAKLVKDLKTTDPNSEYSKNIIKESESVIEK